MVELVFLWFINKHLLCLIVASLNKLKLCEIGWQLRYFKTSFSCRGQIDPHHLIILSWELAPMTVWALQDEGGVFRSISYLILLQLYFEFWESSSCSVTSTVWSIVQHFLGKVRKGDGGERCPNWWRGGGPCLHFWFKSSNFSAARLIREFFFQK